MTATAVEPSCRRITIARESSWLVFSFYDGNNLLLHSVSVPEYLGRWLKMDPQDAMAALEKHLTQTKRISE